MECVAITNKGTRCSRNAISNSKYCWQHQPIYLSLQPEILNRIYSYSGTLNPINKILQNNINKRKILENWFNNINVKTSFSEVKESEIELLWGLYQKRIDNVPANNLLELAIKNGLNPNYFYAKEFVYQGFIPNLAERLNDLDQNIHTINENEDLKNFVI